MYKQGAILLVDDDPDDLDSFREALKTLNLTNNVLSFNNGFAALEFLRKNEEKVFFILSDINMPKMDGFEFREEIVKDNDLFLRAVPFLFTSTSSSLGTIAKAYNFSAQGFFKKPSTYHGIIDMFKAIILYWGVCLQPIENDYQFYD